MADRQGFEPWIPFRGIHDFQSCAFDHSAIYPSAFLFIIIKLVFDKYFFCLKPNYFSFNPSPKIQGLTCRPADSLRDHNLLVFAKVKSLSEVFFVKIPPDDIV